MDFEMQSSRQQQAQQRKSTYAVVFVVFALICLITSFFLNSNAGKPLLFQIPASGSTQPQKLEVPHDRAVYQVRVWQATTGMADNIDWSAVTCEVMDENGEHLFGFGDEFWTASGYDEGHWSETKNNYKMKMTFPKKGNYLLAFETERSKPQLSQPVSVKVERKAASSLPFLWAGVFSLIIGVVLACTANPRIFENAG